MIRQFFRFISIPEQGIAIVGIGIVFVPIAVVIARAIIVYRFRVVVVGLGIRTPDDLVVVVMVADTTVNRAVMLNDLTMPGALSLHPLSGTRGDGLARPHSAVVIVGITTRLACTGSVPQNVHTRLTIATAIGPEWVTIRTMMFFAIIVTRLADGNTMITGLQPT